MCVCIPGEIRMELLQVCERLSPSGSTDRQAEGAVVVTAKQHFCLSVCLSSECVCAVRVCVCVCVCVLGVNRVKERAVK